MEASQPATAAPDAVPAGGVPRRRRSTVGRRELLLGAALVVGVLVAQAISAYDRTPARPVGMAVAFALGLAVALLARRLAIVAVAWCAAALLVLVLAAPLAVLMQATVPCGPSTVCVARVDGGAVVPVPLLAAFGIITAAVFLEWLWAMPAACDEPGTFCEGVGLDRLVILFGVPSLVLGMAAALATWTWWRTRPRVPRSA